jgi:hypothetical protein
MTEAEEAKGAGLDVERYEHVVSWMMDMYSRGQVPTLEAICRSFGLTPAEALACLAEFHRRFPIAFPITFQVAAKNPQVFWGVNMPLFGKPPRRVKRLGPPGVAISRPYRWLAILLWLAGIVLIVLSFVLMGLYGGVP